ncbi:hypothetical protein [Roseovarius atlanticus]|uniref:hypothetical protein n=1 Tax=Roseovarius atlanticus TaxID=1641875 RepID=UPI001C9453F2|nr:hypothetical protein [Roseovarius atlanticus]MBY5988196.1 hypothetical protein [Roseovarius atlanticus]MBY6123587.1 hypothetical protein [Roseovarius atlanticus]MBY6148082.1 hypothetical protein [Roseovarius atlanticus]
MTKSKELQSVLNDIRSQRAALDVQATALTEIAKFQNKLKGRGCSVSVGVNGTHVTLNIDLSPPAALPAPESAAASTGASSAATATVSGPFSDEENERILKLHDEGFGREDIAAKLERKFGAVALQLGRLLKKREKGKPAAEPEPERNPEPEPEPDLAPEANPEPAPKLKPTLGKPPNSRLIQSPGVTPPRPQHHPLDVYEWAIFCALERIDLTEIWDPQKDLELCHGILAGNRLDVAAAAVRISPELAKARWEQLNTKPGDLDHQRRLVAVLKYRAAQASA